MPTLQERQAFILRSLVEDYIKGAQPVSSLSLVRHLCLPWSSATIRNDLMELERGGFLVQPHYASGRIPTPKGYRYFVDNFLGDDEVVDSSIRQVLVRQLSRMRNEVQTLERIGEFLASATDMVSFTTPSPNRPPLFYGLGRVFCAPEFREIQRVQRFAQLVDRMHEHFTELLDVVEDEEPTILIGSETPFPEAEEISIVISALRPKRREPMYVGLVGPQRMDYRRNQALVSFLHDLLEEKFE